MQIYRFNIDDAARTIITIDLCDEYCDKDCDGDHYNYLADKKSDKYEKELIDDVYNYYIRCINFIKDNWKEYYGLTV
ncbi:hypothetical protein LBA_01027 [Megavirus lba]|uniref:Uncharacterized protein n=1 Tax=Megavirus lba TaxID=1235314 RepID=L7XZS6_9VIRU|nr:hypothetical protein LBA_01027 [Megavirus lba]